MQGVRVHCLKSTGSKTAGAILSLENSKYFQLVSHYRHFLFNPFSKRYMMLLGLCL